MNAKSLVLTVLLASGAVALGAQSTPQPAPAPQPSRACSSAVPERAFRATKAS